MVVPNVSQNLAGRTGSVVLGAIVWIGAAAGAHAGPIEVLFNCNTVQAGDSA